MTDQKGNGTTTALWQDHHSGKRGHQLMTEKLADTIPAIGATDNARDYDDVLARAKLFSPTRIGRGSSPSWTARPASASAWWKVWKGSWAISISPSWPRPPCSAACPPWSATSTGSP